MVNAMVTVIKAKIIQPRVDEVSRMIVLGILVASIVLQRVQGDYHVLSKKLRQKRIQIATCEDQPQLGQLGTLPKLPTPPGLACISGGLTFAELRSMLHHFCLSQA